MSNCSASSPAVLSPCESKRRTSRRVGSESALNTAFMPDIEDPFVRSGFLFRRSSNYQVRDDGVKERRADALPVFGAVCRGMADGRWPMTGLLNFFGHRSSA